MNYKVLIIVAMVVFLGFCYGCRTKSKVAINYLETGAVASIVYENDSGFSFFSEGNGKVISPSLTVNGVQF